MRGYFPIRRSGCFSLLLLASFFFTFAPAKVAAGSASGKKLVKALKHSSFKVRLQAVILIGKRKMKSAAPELRQALSDKHDAVRAAAALSLGKLGDEESRNSLVKLLDHQNELVVKTAEKALVLLDKKKGQAVYLVAIQRPILPGGVSRSRAARLMRTIRKKLEETSGLVVSAGEENVLSAQDLTSHLRKRKLTGILLQPKLAELNETADGGTTTVAGKVSIMVVTLIRKRMEFNASGEANAWVEDAPISDGDRTDLQNAVLDGASSAAIEQVVQYLAGRDNY